MPMLYPHNRNFFTTQEHIEHDRPINKHNTVKLKQALFDTGDYKGNMNAQPNHDMFDALRGFQKRKGLSVDAWIRPDGPTASSLNAELAKKIGGGYQPIPTMRIVASPLVVDLI